MSAQVLVQEPSVVTFVHGGRLFTTESRLKTPYQTQWWNVESLQPSVMSIIILLRQYVGRKLLSNYNWYFCKKKKNIYI